MENDFSKSIKTDRSNVRVEGEKFKSSIAINILECQGASINFQNKKIKIYSGI